MGIGYFFLCIYSTYASGAELAGDKQAGYLKAWLRIWTWNYREQIQLAVRAGLELMASGLQVHHPNCWATKKNEWENCMGLYNDEPKAMVLHALLL